MERKNDKPKVKILKSGDILLRQGEDSRCMYWVQKGQLRVEKNRVSGDVLLGHVYENELVGEISFLDKEKRSATVIAETDCEVVEIPEDKFQEIVEAAPVWTQVLIKTLAERLRKANARIKI